MSAWEPFKEERHVSKFKLDQHDPLNNILDRAVMHTLSHALPKDEQEKLITEYRDNPEGWDIKLTINGREADMKVWLDHLAKGWDADVYREAAKLVEERMQEKMGPLWTMLNEVERAIRHETLKALGLNEGYWEDR